MTRSLLARLLFLLTLAVTVSGCEIVGGIFKAGMWVGVIMVVLVVALIVWVMNKART
jgi:hypothetical protein